MTSLQALDERLRVLREVDETIWGVIGELTALRSRWETEEITYVLDQHNSDTTKSNFGVSSAGPSTTAAGSQDQVGGRGLADGVSPPILPDIALD